MAARDIFTGGACNVNEQSSGQVNQNPFMKFMDNMFTGNGQNKQMVQGFQQEQGGDIVEQQMKERQQQMMMMGNQWDDLERDFKQKAKVDMQMNQMMDKQFHIEQMAHQQRMQFQQMQMQQAWNNEKLNYNSEQWAQQHQMEQAFDEAKQQVQQEQVGKDEEQERIHNAANQLFDQMAKDEDPRFKNSKFLSFLGQIKSGEVKIQGKELIKNSAEESKTMENVWEESKEAVQKDNLEMMNQAWNKAEEQQGQEQEKLEDFWAKRIAEYERDAENDEKFASQLEDQYQQVLKQMNSEKEGNWEDLMGDAWEKANDIEEHALYRDASDKYDFNPNNPYLQHENPFALGLELLAQGKVADAILAFEAQIQKDPQSKSNGNTWRIMGRLLQDNDQDQKAVACFLNCLKFDETNLDTLLALGISCTNILDEVKGMNFLKSWLINNKNYAGLQIDPNIIPNETTHEFTVEEIRMINQKMIGVFEHAKQVNPNDPELLQSLAVLHFIARDYEKSVVLFQQALNIDSENYSLWNKLGATLAHLGRADEAMDAYHRALDIKPNYVRAWVNLGIAYAYKADYQEAARFYLNALSFNPDANHVWSYIQTTFMCMQRLDLVSKIAQKDVNAFKDEFDILSLEELPPPEISYGLSSANVVLKKNQVNPNIMQQAENWAKDLNNNNQ